MQSIHGRMALGRKLQQPWKEILGSRMGGLGDGVWILGGHIPFTLLTPPSWRGHRGGPDGGSVATNLSQKAMATWLKRCLWEKMARIMQAEEEGRIHIPATPGTGSATHLFRAFRVKVHLKMGEKRIAFQKKIGLQREYFENKCLEIFLFRDYC